MASGYSSTFPAGPPGDYDDLSSVARHDQQAFDELESLLCHWERPHRRSYHWMITFEEHPQVAALSQHCQQLLPRHGLDLIPPESLHLTVRRFGYADEVPETRVRAAVGQVAAGCDAISPFRLGILPLAGSPGAIRCSVAPWTPLLRLYRLVSLASGYGDGDPLLRFRPHVGVAYSSRVQPARPHVAAVRRARELGPTEVMIAELRLVELYRVDHQYRWCVLERFPLRGRQDGQAGA